MGDGCGIVIGGQWMIIDGCKNMDDGLRITRDQLCVSDHVPSRGFCFPERDTPKNKLCVSDRVPSRGFCFPGKHTPKNKLCVSDRVPSRGFCFPLKIAKINISLAGYFQTAPLRE